MKNAVLWIWLPLLLLGALLLFMRMGEAAFSKRPDAQLSFKALQTASAPRPAIGRLTHIPGSNEFFISGPALPLARVNAAGQVLWQDSAGAFQMPKTLPLSDGRAWLRCTDLQLSMPVLARINADGSEAWRQTIAAPATQTDVQLALCGDKLAVGIDDKLWLLDGQGKTLWALDQLPGLRLLGHCGPGGEILASSAAGGLHCLSAAGQELWRSGKSSESLQAVESLAGQDWVALTDGARLRAYDLSGALLWEQGLTPGTRQPRPVKLLGDCVLVKQDWHNWDCFDRDGRLRFRLETVGDLDLDLQRDGEGNFYVLYLTARHLGYGNLQLFGQSLLLRLRQGVPKAEAHLYCLSPQGRRLWQARFDYLPRGPWLLPDGSVAISKGLELMSYKPQP
ncbi:PQQ-binding-like beta-propeller repeat protein [bacterium]|nr:PQQ-binding-like beta-propeller repeat protein [bacterium]